jgi:uncharacterized protein (UPF0371 family)
MEKPSGMCQRCSKGFTQSARNASRQKYCKRAVCVTDRRRERQRQHYTKRYHADEEFRRQERERCSVALKARRSTAHRTALMSVNDGLVIRGMLASMLESCDSHEVLEVARSYESRGQALLP